MQKIYKKRLAYEKNNFYFWIIAVMSVSGLLVVSCEKISDDISPNDRKKTSHFVSRESAFKKVERFFADRSTRADYSLSVEDYLFYRCTSDTRSDVASNACFHVFNFADNSGFAIVAADDRATDIYAYAMEGHIDFDEAMEHTGFSVFMDGAVELYNQEVDGGFIGPDSLLERPPFEQVDDLDKYTTIDTVDFHVIEQKEPFLDTCWGQGQPYNRYCFCDDGTQALAGCAPIAITQIMAYHEWPVTIDGRFLDWGVIKRYPYVEETNQAADNLSYLISRIGLVAGAVYGVSATSTPTANVTNAFEYFGYTSDGLHVFNEHDAKYSVYNDRPLYSRGTSDTGGHGWVIDGYKCERKTINYYNYYLYVYNPFKSIYIDRIYFHCNWGWNGSSDGFYLSDAFLSYKREVQMIANINVE